MKTKFFNPFVCTCIFSLSLLQGCDKDPEPCIEIGGIENGAVKNGTTAKQVDMAEIVPIHSTNFKVRDKTSLIRMKAILRGGFLLLIVSLQV